MDIHQNIEDLLHNLFEGRYANVDDFNEQLDGIATSEAPSMSFIMLLNYKIFEAEKSLCAFLAAKSPRKDSLTVNLKKAIAKFLCRLTKAKSMVLAKNVSGLFVG